MSIPIGSTVVVQWEGGGLWTHSTIIGRGNHNHHNRSYRIQVTNTGRIIICSRQQIKPTPITVEDYIHYQANKHAKTDPLDAILDHIWKNPPTPTDKTISNERDDNKICRVNMKIEPIYKAAEKNRQRKYVLTQGWTMNTKNEGENIVKTRYRRIVNKPDRLTHQQ